MRAGLDLVAEAEILAEFRATTAAFARPERSGPPAPVLTAEEQAECVRLAQEHDRRVRPPLQAIRVNRESGAIIGVMMRRNSPMQGSAARPAAARPVSRPRESRPSRRRNGTRASPSGEDGEPPQLARACGYCGRALEHKRSHAVFCCASCRVMACRARKRERPAGLTAEALEATLAEEEYVSRLPAGFAATVLADFEARGYVRRLPDGSFGATERALVQLCDFWTAA